MIAHYKKTNRAVASIDLDLKNPRLAGLIKRQAITSQAEAAVALTKSSDVISLCTSIVNNGFHPDEVLIAINNESGKQNRVTVIEGNRRLTACKLLLKPKLVKGTSDFTKLQKLSKHPNFPLVLASIKRLSVVILDNRYSAAAYLASKHTSESIKRWSPYTQGAYIYGFLQEFHTVSAVKDVLRNTMSITDIKKRLFTFLLTEEILNLDCWSEKELDFLTTQIDNNNIGAIIRLMSNSDFIDTVCDVKVMNNGQLRVTSKSSSEIHTDELMFLRILEKLARDALIKSRFNTRQEDKDTIREYIAEFQTEFASQSPNTEKAEHQFSRILPQGDESGDASTHTQEKFDDEQKQNSTKDITQEKQEQTKKPRRTPETLIPKELQIPNVNTKLISLCNEAQKIIFRQNKYSSALMIRAIIEVTLKVIINRKNLSEELRKQYTDKSQDLSNILNFVEKNANKLVGQDDMKLVRNAVSDLQKTSKELLNLTNHNDKQILTEKEVEHLRSKMLEILHAVFPQL
ncbi:MULTISPECIES: hypothetical protein [Vibrio]|uniref:hypothetical protein n=1 Tax=Vibrio TaxID=662 RepID=UPI00097E2A84|nr:MULTISPECIES: hypothetical protein [Vibrio]AQM20511.1 hypothetical protein PN51_12270 [Vibrio anguillarum]AQP37108.1 hypothetical protein AA909_12425 [Vibrio anguillarum]AUB88973.1 hypothetical protein CKY00_17255 [Vibrio anguillarum]AUB92413.1 hypothetical protein CKX99_17270 [Vibrio anguillarum]AUB95848.1 hypothetical protein CK210_17255 [Vibrio anguillarum]